jgi:hypothetical protein
LRNVSGSPGCRVAVTSQIRRSVGRGHRQLGSPRRPSQARCAGRGAALAGKARHLGGHRSRALGALGGPIPEHRSNRAVGCLGRRRRSDFHCPTLARRRVGLGVSSSANEAITDHDPRQGRRGSRGLGLHSGDLPVQVGGGLGPPWRTSIGRWGVMEAVLGACPARAGTEFEDRGDRRRQSGGIKPNSGDGKPAVGVGRTQFRGWEAGSRVDFGILPPIAEGRWVVLKSNRADRRRRLGGPGARPR